MVSSNESEFTAPVIAHRTKALIDQMIAADGGARFRQLSQKWLPRMSDAYRGQEFKYRNHFGFSGAADKCQRKPWLAWRWASTPQFDGRILRLFNRGHLEEARFLAMLEMIGCEIWQSDENGKQFSAGYLGGMYGGSGDGFARGIPDLPVGQVFATEFKSANQKNFVKYETDGVRKTSPKYFGQCQQIMRAFKLPVTLFMMANKNTDELYCELIPLYKGAAEVLHNTIIKTVTSPFPPKGISSKRTFWECKQCDRFAVCKMDVAPDRTCRSCGHVRPNFDDGGWYCGHPNNAEPVLIGDQQAQVTTAERCGAYYCDWSDHL